MALDTDPYPLRFDVDYPEQLSRVTTAFRLILAIPIWIVLATLTGGATGIYSDPPGGADLTTFTIGGGGLLVAGPVLMILFRQKYPRWWFDFNRELLRFTARVTVYGALLRDEYPSTDEQQAVRLDIDYPDAERDLNRWLPLVKWLLAIPHVIVLVVLGFLAFFAVLFAWFAILFTGRYPLGLFNFVVGVQRWALRVEAYALLMVTDRYPPFSMS